MKTLNLQQIKTRCKVLGITIDQICGVMGMTKQNFFHIERNDRVLKMKYRDEATKFLAQYESEFKKRVL